MSDETSMARRYHWLSDDVQSYVNEPHSAVCCDTTGCCCRPTRTLPPTSSTARGRASAIRRETLDAMRSALGRARIGHAEQMHAFRRLARFADERINGGG